MRGYHVGEIGLMAGADDGHLAGAAGHAGEIGGGAVIAGASENPNTDQAKQEGAAGADHYQPQMADDLFKDGGSEVQTYGAGDYPLPGLA